MVGYAGTQQWMFWVKVERVERQRISPREHTPTFTSTSRGKRVGKMQYLGQTYYSFNQSVDLTRKSSCVDCAPATSCPFFFFERGAMKLAGATTPMFPVSVTECVRRYNDELLRARDNWLAIRNSRRTVVQCCRLELEMLYNYCLISEASNGNIYGISSAFNVYH